MFELHLPESVNMYNENDVTTLTGSRLHPVQAFLAITRPVFGIPRGTDMPVKPTG